MKEKQSDSLKLPPLVQVAYELFTVGMVTAFVHLTRFTKRRESADAAIQKEVTDPQISEEKVHVARISSHAMNFTRELHKRFFFLNTKPQKNVRSFNDSKLKLTGS